MFSPLERTLAVSLGILFRGGIATKQGLSDVANDKTYSLRAIYFFFVVGWASSKLNEVVTNPVGLQNRA
ncbi:hypothetical protein [Nostoc sp.]|uniref:hypothetical protein n=1 Tax=Nostoc sp. TaxID=1180 RepID=UPI002FF4C2F5